MNKIEKEIIQTHLTEAEKKIEADYKFIIDKLLDQVNLLSERMEKQERAINWLAWWFGATDKDLKKLDEIFK